MIVGVPTDVGSSYLYKHKERQFANKTAHRQPNQGTLSYPVCVQHMAGLFKARPACAGGRY